MQAPKGRGASRNERTVQLAHFKHVEGRYNCNLQPAHRFASFSALQLTPHMCL